MLLSTVFTVAPIYTHAALPTVLQTALTQAELSQDNISILITPVGSIKDSRLPPIEQVIDSTEHIDSTENIDSTEHLKSPEQLQTTDASHTSDNIKQAKDIAAAKLSTPQLLDAIPSVSKQSIKQSERERNAYTDDPYTHQSLNGESQSLEGTSMQMATTATQDGITATTINMSAPPLFSHQPNLSRTPASTMKLIPSFIALDTLGADFVWHTRAFHTGLIIGDRLHGDLIIQGSGDPKMTHERLGQLLFQIKKAGIRHVVGDIIIDSAIFKQVSKDPSAFDNAPLRPYNASPDGFLVNFNALSIHSYPVADDKARLTYTPELANYKLPTSIGIRQGSCSAASNSIAPQWQVDKLTLNTKLPDRCGEHVFYVAHPDAKDFAARVIEAKWRALGNTVSGKVRAQETAYDPMIALPSKHGLTALSLSPLPITSYPSLTLAQQIYDINHYSNNVMTEQLALSLGAYQQKKPDQAEILNRATAASLYHFGKPAATDYPQALQTISTWWQQNLSTPPPYLTNGSGLCRDCSVTAANLNELLSFAYNHPSFDVYVHSLGVAGVSGTITAHAERLPESVAIGRAWIKTGTLNNVTSMAGYVKGRSGQDYVVVGLINSEQALHTNRARAILDQLLDWTAQH